MNRFELTIIFSLFVSVANAQDIHFTQWMHAPHTYSPSSIGDFNGIHRFHGNYRNQWSSVTVPFVTFAGFTETNTLSNYVDGLSGAAGLVYDVTGDSKFSTTQLNLGAGYKVPFSDSLGDIRIGILPTITQKKIDLDALKFDNQYNGYYFDGNLSTGEQLPRLTRWYLDIALGIQFSRTINNNLKFKTSLAVYNLLSPQQSFFNNNDIILDRRFSAQIELKYNLSEKLTFVPGIQISKQGTYYAANFGSMISLNMSKTQYLNQAFFVGTYFRAVDSGDLIFGLDYDSWRFGVSYDINFSGLIPASNYRGGLEIAVIYIIPNKIIRPKYKVCPDY